MQTLSKHIIFQPKHTPADLEPGAVREVGSGGATGRRAEDGGPREAARAQPKLILTRPREVSGLGTC